MARGVRRSQREHPNRPLLKPPHPIAIPTPVPMLHSQLSWGMWLSFQGVLAGHEHKEGNKTTHARHIRRGDEALRNRAGFTGEGMGGAGGEIHPQFFTGVERAALVEWKHQRQHRCGNEQGSKKVDKAGSGDQSTRRTASGRGGLSAASATAHPLKAGRLVYSRLWYRVARHDRSARQGATLQPFRSVSTRVKPSSKTREFGAPNFHSNQQSCRKSS
ncbi:hypothetical protein B0T24DRAFT_235680 [Lasiosphaeria ovina]|uniref:Uncharacterized protein n=1 Tax=Lasiosphaeria ovina TaxID=92902 RepID=A0AAE0NAT9_9PEZI|nr:hypothetical protein B0T24DRAFT_235680 [Lasiosphaeria ovina]